MPKRILAIFLLIAVISSNFSRFFVYAGFQANQKYIASTLCENKNKPWLNCEGRCYLMKKLKDTEKKENKQEQEQKRNQYQEAFFLYTSTGPRSIPNALKCDYPEAETPALVQQAIAVFLPPKIV